MASKDHTLFTGYNYYLLLLAGSLVVLGFLLMTGNSASGDDAFDKIFSFRRITLAPVVILTGYILIIPAIMWNRKSDHNGKPRKGKI